MRVFTRQVAPGYVQQMQQPCPTCRGHGATVPPGATCSRCRGKGMSTKKENLPVEVVPGCPSRKRFVFQGLADEEPDMETGDIIIELREKAHAHFRRFADKHLFCHRKVPLLDALSGVRFSVKHVDGTDLEVRCPEGTVVRPGEVWVVKGRGMPDPSRRGSFGDLFVQFDVEFPEKLFNAQGGGLRDQLRPLLDPSAPAVPTSSGGRGGILPGMFSRRGAAEPQPDAAYRASPEVQERITRMLEEQEEWGSGERRPRRGNGGTECKTM